MNECMNETAECMNECMNNATSSMTPDQLNAGMNETAVSEPYYSSPPSYQDCSGCHSDNTGIELVWCVWCLAIAACRGWGVKQSHTWRGDHQQQPGP